MPWQASTDGPLWFNSPAERSDEAAAVFTGDQVVAEDLATVPVPRRR